MKFQIQVQGVGDTIKLITLESDRQVTLALQKIGMEAFKSVVQMSPVDLGRFRANWGVSIGSPSGGTSNALDKQPFGSSPGSPSEMAAAGVLNKVNRKTRAIWINNNLPYAQRLEDGHSPQSRDMVKRTLKSITAMFT
jgi:hypothetical protein